MFAFTVSNIDKQCGKQFQTLSKKCCAHLARSTRTAELRTDIEKARKFGESPLWLDNVLCRIHQYAGTFRVRPGGPDKRLPRRTSYRIICKLARFNEVLLEAIARFPMSSVHSITLWHERAHDQVDGHGMSTIECVDTTPGGKASSKPAVLPTIVSKSKV